MLTTANHESLSNQKIHPGRQPTNELIHEEKQRDQKAGLYLFIYTERLLVQSDTAPAAFAE